MFSLVLKLCLYFGGVNIVLPNVIGYDFTRQSEKRESINVLKKMGPSNVETF